MAVGREVEGLGFFQKGLQLDKYRTSPAHFPMSVYYFSLFSNPGTILDIKQCTECSYFTLKLVLLVLDSQKLVDL